MTSAVGNFEFLAKHDPLFLQLARAAERAFVPDPATTVIKLRQLGEAFAKHAAASAGLYAGRETQQLDVLRDLERALIVEGRTKDLFHLLRREGNRAVHDFTADHKLALDQLKAARQLAIWFHRTFGGLESFKPGPFQNPPDPEAELLAKEQEAARLRAELTETQETVRVRGELARAEAEQARAAQEAAKKAEAERAEWEALAASYEAELAKARAAFEAQVVEQQEQVLSGPSQPAAEQEVQKAAQRAENALDLSEAETRLLIDAQLRQAGWEADSELLRHSAGSRPQKGKNVAIAEWPTAAGPADYVLFTGLTPVAVVEAKKKNKNIPGALEQAKRYALAYCYEPPQKLAYGARRYVSQDEHHSIAKDADPSQLSGAFGWYARDEGGTPRAYRVPFLYSTNGREFVRQLEALSGIWFLDARRPTNTSRALLGWHSPEKLEALLEKDEAGCSERARSPTPIRSVSRPTAFGKPASPTTSGSGPAASSTPPSNKRSTRRPSSASSTDRRPATSAPSSPTRRRGPTRTGPSSSPPARRTVTSTPGSERRRIGRASTATSSFGGSGAAASSSARSSARLRGRAPDARSRLTGRSLARAAMVCSAPSPPPPGGPRRFRS